MGCNGVVEELKMTKSQNTIDEQQNDLCITSEQLTEQWKKGELPDGWYWVKGVRAEGIYAYTSEYLNNMYRPRNGEMIIEKAPSYEKWEKFRNALADNQIENSNLLIENTKLKELLKQYKEDILNDCDWYIDAGEKIRQINQVLGEE